MKIILKKENLPSGRLSTNILLAPNSVKKSWTTKKKIKEQQMWIKKSRKKNNLERKKIDTYLTCIAISIDVTQAFSCSVFCLKKKKKRVYGTDGKKKKRGLGGG